MQSAEEFIIFAAATASWSVTNLLVICLNWKELNVQLGEIDVHSQQVVTVIQGAPVIIPVMELLDYAVAFSSLSVVMGPK